MLKDAPQSGYRISVGGEATGRVLHFDTSVLLTVNMPFLTHFCGTNEVSVRYMYMHLFGHMICCMLATENEYI